MNGISDCTTILQREPAEVYHAKAGEYLTSHLLADFRKCPLLYHRKRLGLIQDEDRPAYLVGRAAHAVILEGDAAFQQRYAVGGPVNPKTGRPYGASTKICSRWAKQHCKDVLSRQQRDVVMAMAESAKQHAWIQELLTDGVAEGVVRAEYCGRPCQIRMDWLNPYLGVLDLKSADDLTWFEADARRFGYAYQVSFYVEVLRQVIGLRMPAFLAAVEKKPPFRCGLWKLSDDLLTRAARENEAAMGRLQQCIDSGRWPTGYEDLRCFDGP